MKAKLILAAMAMPVLFAACTSDELVPMEQGQGQQARPTVSKDFVIRSTAEGMQEDTRYAIQYGADQWKIVDFKYENGDTYGVATTDDWNDEQQPNEFKIIDGQGGSNLKFTYNASMNVWESQVDEGVGAGHNIFSYPFSKKDLGRGPISWSLPAVQWLATNLDETTGLPTANSELDLDAEIVRSNKAFAGAVLPAGATDVNVKMRNLFSYPAFCFKFDNFKNVTNVDKIVLELESRTVTVDPNTEVETYGAWTASEFHVGGGLNHHAIWQIYEDGAPGDNIYGDKNEDWAEVLTTAALVRGTDKPEAETSRYIMARFPEGDGEVTNDEKNNPVVNVRFMLPGYELKLYTGEGWGIKNDYKKATQRIHAYIYTNVGTFEVEDLCAAIEFSNSTSNTVKRTAIARNKFFYMNIAVNRIVEADEAPAIVTNVDEWNDLVEEYGTNSNYNAASPLPVALMEGFAFDSGAGMPTVATFEVVEGNAYIAEGTYNDKAKNAGALAARLSNVKVKNLVVPATGEVELGKGFQAETVENKGRISFPSRGVSYTEAINGIITNEGIITVETGANVQIDKLENKKGATFNNNGTAKVGFNNSGKIVNAASAKMYAIKNDGYSSVNKRVSANEIGVIENNGDFDGDGVMTNDGIIKQNKNIQDIVPTAESLIEIGAGATDTELDVDLGDIDITNNWDARITCGTGGLPSGNLIYYIKADAEGKYNKSIKALNEKVGLKEIYLDGGKITESTDDDCLTLGDDQTLEITSNGGTIEGAATKTNSYTKPLEFNGNVVVKNFTFGDVHIMNNKTEVQGNVTVNGIVMGSKPSTTDVYAELNVVSGAKLTVGNNSNESPATVFANYRAEQNGYNKVVNDGTIEYITKGTGEINQTLFDWQKHDAKKDVTSDAPSATKEINAGTITYNITLKVAGNGAVGDITYSNLVSHMANTYKSIDYTNATIDDNETYNYVCYGEIQDMWRLFKTADTYEKAADPRTVTNNSTASVVNNDYGHKAVVINITNDVIVESTKNGVNYGYVGIDFAGQVDEVDRTIGEGDNAVVYNLTRGQMLAEIANDKDVTFKNVQVTGLTPAMGLKFKTLSVEGDKTDANNCRVRIEGTANQKLITLTDGFDYSGVATNASNGGVRFVITGGYILLDKSVEIGSTSYVTVNTTRGAKSNDSYNTGWILAKDSKLTGAYVEWGYGSTGWTSFDEDIVK